ncbi:hypothetical protein GUITHDRAFT_89903 [Guillardia theta CCMP2712]|uniref:Kinesin motor domain-containing protein n=1 Tax=Guillardia theta (strain CCMP2712) TaxID=905079 RepID=L1IKS8_GUITC|nr:hypothetical protein GUITHDRAFT_89903 [Guillardia theta CCMP2712]EKX36831.1 hypothetical protein GUITHDRAFT_89903 [Guillardia theta CCMP2712]|eukprot:XP_005823811.1 hypothetical protein GUITHDRAFT_89903 [Guillardia theta CCMP2712]
MQQRLERAQQERDDLTELTQQQERLIAGLEDQLHQSERRRAQLHNQIQELRGNIRVFCRIRPFLQEEATMDAPSDMTFGRSGDRPSILISLPPPQGGRKKDSQSLSFEYDEVFDPQSSQASVFREIEPLMQSVMDGYRVCIFAYGQTGSGKTHTMEGKIRAGKQDEQRGVVPRCMERLIELRNEMQKRDWSINLQCSCLEIYNEVIRDLLCDKEDASKKLEIKHDKSTGDVVVTNLTQLPVQSEEEIYRIIQSASRRRETASTVRNATSSRSHSVLQLTVECKHMRTGESKKGILNMVDLAGSERISIDHDSKTTKEAQNINKSLSSLLGVIQALASKQAHVPFRNSKLTHLLSSSLAGDGKALMFANLSPRLQHVHESINTLRFAAQVNVCQLGHGKLKAGE